MKIRVIDLLNKIARGEEIPKKIKYKNEIYIFCNKAYDTNTYFRENDENDLFSDIYADKDDLNDEIEIIEEPKKIEKITWKPAESLAGDIKDKQILEIFARRTEKLKKSLNEIIDKINEMSDK